jgi:hypothetical protein
MVKTVTMPPAARMSAGRTLSTQKADVTILEEFDEANWTFCRGCIFCAKNDASGTGPVNESIDQSTRQPFETIVGEQIVALGSLWRGRTTLQTRARDR